MKGNTPLKIEEPVNQVSEVPKRDSGPSLAQIAHVGLVAVKATPLRGVLRPALTAPFVLRGLTAHEGLRKNVRQF